MVNDLEEYTVESSFSDQNDMFIDSNFCTFFENKSWCVFVVYTWCPNIFLSVPILGHWPDQLFQNLWLFYNRRYLVNTGGNDSKFCEAQKVNILSLISRKY